MNNCAYPVEANIIFKNDFESGTFQGITRQYQSYTCRQDRSYIDKNLFQIISDKTRFGKFALKHHVQNCDERSELTVPSGFLKSEQEYWIGWSYFFPKNFIKPVSGRDTYTIIHQMLYEKAWIDQQQGRTIFECSMKGNKGGIYQSFGPPGSDMTISSDGKSYLYKLKFYKGKDNQGRNIFGCKELTFSATIEQWEDFVMNVKFSDVSDRGFVKLWKNGQLVMNEKVALLAPGKGVGAWKIGVYVGDPGNGERIVYTDELKVGNEHSSMNEVSPFKK